MTNALRWVPGQRPKTMVADLTAMQIRDILDRHDDGQSLRAIAQDLGLGKDQIVRIIRERTGR